MKLKPVYIWEGLFAIIVLLFFACKKEKPEPVTTVTPIDSTVTIVALPPDNFTKKVLVEDFTSTTCGYCALGIDAMHRIDSAFGSRAIIVSFHGHGNDPMHTFLYDTLGKYFQNVVIPAGCVNRLVNSFNMPPLNFPSMFITPQLNLAATCGLAIDATNVEDSVAQVVIKAGFNQTLTGDTRLVAYLVEDSVTGGTLYSQQNWNCSGCSDPYPGSYFYNLPGVISPFYHRDVFRKQLTPDYAWGDTIPASCIHALGEFKKTYTVSKGSSTNSFYIVAFITTHGADHLTHLVLNAQKVKWGAVKNYD